MYLNNFLRLACFIQIDKLADFPLFSKTLKAILETTCGIYCNLSVFFSDKIADSTSFFFQHASQNRISRVKIEHVGNSRD